MKLTDHVHSPTAMTYKAQAKEQAAATERERAAKQAMQAKCNAALQRVQQLEAGGGGGAVTASSSLSSWISKD